MKIKKSRIAVVCSLLFLVVIAASCGGSNEPKKIKIGVSVPAADHGWTAGVGYWAKTEMAKYPDIEWVYATANEPGKQTSDIEDMMTQNVNALVILATESAPITPVAKKAKERGMWNQQKALEVMQSYLASYPKIDAVWASDDDMALGAEKAIKESGRIN